MSKSVPRLFRQFEPEKYELKLHVEPDEMRFKGTIVIKGKKVGRPSQRLTFHQSGLKVTTAEIIRHDKRSGDHKTIPSRINLQNTFDEVRLHNSHVLYPGNYTIKLEFEGLITKPMEGIYPCFYKHDGIDKKLIATQFESHHARQVFPCIDEPEAKALFDLTLLVPSGNNALSNTPVKKQHDKHGLTEVSFETTPRMSTYLLAFVIGELHGVEAKTKRGVIVRSWATVAQPKKQLEYANKEAVDILEFFEEYFQVPFPLPKLDQVALPDFDALAMENWGLITFREIGLLADPDNRSISGERLITQVIAHEMSHQWFGNLVTMKWWDDLWLNESFASIMESLAPDRLHPDWQEWEDFVAGRVLGAADRDVYKDVQPVGVKVHHPDDILTLFDPSIVYAKGARILKMMFDFIGEEAFRAGLTGYFKKHAYQNTTGNDLWQAMSDASGIDIGSLMTPWIEQSGTPELTIRRDGEDALKLSQNRFLLDGSDKVTEWPIPLLADQPLELKIMEAKEVTIDINHDSLPVFNPLGSAHFISHYEDKAAAALLSEDIKKRRINSQGRIVALSDMLLLARKGHYNLADMLDLISACKHEDRDAVWSMFVRVMGNAGALTDGDEDVEVKLRKFRQEMAEYWYDRLGWVDKTDDEPNTKHLRTTMVALSVGGESKQALDVALKHFSKVKKVEDLPAEQRAIIAGAAVRFGKPEVVEQLMHEYETTRSADIKESITAALCSTRLESVGKQIVEWGMYDDSVIKPQDIDHFFALLLRNYHTRMIAWQWLQDRWPHLTEQFGGGKKMEYFIWYGSRPMSTPEWQKRYEDFFKPKLDDQSLKRNLLISFAEIQARVDWRKREEPRLKKYFLK